MKKYYEVMRVQGDNEFIESKHTTIEDANAAAESLAERIVAYGQGSKVKRYYTVYVAETCMDDDDERISTDGAVGGCSKTVRGIL